MRIFLVRHGESLGNLDGRAYRQYGDHNVPLSQWGFRQVTQAGDSIAAYLAGVPDIGSSKLRVWFSPFLRTRQSKDALLATLPAGVIGKVGEDYLLREQDFGLFTEIYGHAEQSQKFPAEFERWARLRSNGAKFYVRPPDGESRADVAQRMRLFLQTVMHEAEHGHDNVMIVGHGVTNRAFEMNFLQHPVDWFEASDNPGNADVTLLEGRRGQGYQSTLLHKATDRLPGEDALQEAYDAAASPVPPGV